MKTHCKHGHKFTKSNVYIRPDGFRECKTCIYSRLQKISDWYPERSRDLQRFGGNRERTIKRDGAACVMCGISREEHKSKYGFDISVDHIDGNGRYTPKAKQNHDINNLQTLCFTCHGKKDKLRGLIGVQL